MGKKVKGSKTSGKVKFLLDVLGLPGEITKLTTEEMNSLMEEAKKSDRAAKFGLSDITANVLVAHLSKLSKKPDGSADVPNDDFTPIAAAVSMEIGGGEYVSAEDVLVMATIAKVFPRRFGRTRGTFEAYKYAVLKCSDNLSSVDNLNASALKAAIDEYTANGIKENRKHSNPDTESKVKKAIRVMEARLKELKDSDFVVKANYDDLSKFCMATSGITTVCGVLSAVASKSK